jgi:hypothetical protein
MEQLSKCCGAEIEWKGELLDTEPYPRCSACRLSYPEIQDPTPPTSSEVEEVKDVLRLYGNWWLHNPKIGLRDKNTTMDIEQATKAITHLIRQEREQTEKAFGGCKKCYGKGYGTATEYTEAFPDFGDEGYSRDKSDPMVYCDCDRGRQLYKLNQERERLARIDAVQRFYGEFTNKVKADDYEWDRGEDVFNNRIAELQKSGGPS